MLGSYPGGHGCGKGMPKSGQMFPKVHFWHELCPDVSWKSPGAQSEKLKRPVG